MRIRTFLLILAAVLLLSPLLLACSSNGDKTIEPTHNATDQPKEDVVIILGNITDRSGAGASAMAIVNDGLEDAVAYFNENKLIPGVKIKIEMYDNEYDVAKEVPGYRLLKSQGADIIIGDMPQTAIILKPFLNEDKTLLFAMPYTQEGFEPPGYSFSLNVPVQNFGPTMLKWVAENDPDFPQDRPARIGAANWDEPQSRSIFEATKKYCQAHPDLFEWEQGYLSERTFNWDIEVEGLKNCDYIMPPMAGLINFTKDYRGGGYTGKFIATDGHAAFVNLVNDAHLWEELDGTLFGLPYGYWTDDTEMINMAKSMVADKHNNSDKHLDGLSYLGPFIAYQGMLSIIAEAATEVGAQNITSEILYETAQSFTTEIDGRPWGFGPTKRYAVDSFGMYRVNGTERDIFRIDPEWLPLVEPE